MEKPQFITKGSFIEAAKKHMKINLNASVNHFNDEKLKYEKDDEEKIKKLIELGKAENYSEAKLLFNLEKSVFDKSEAVSERNKVASELANKIETLPFFNGEWGAGANSLQSYFPSGKILGEQYADNGSMHKYHPTYRLTKEIQRSYGSFVKDKPVIDLGCGPNAADAADLCVRVDASGYIGVDKHSWPHGFSFNKKVSGSSFHYWEEPSCLEDEKENRVLKWTKRDDFIATIYKEDMLEFLAKIKNNSANIFLNGVDKMVIQGGSYEYWGKLITEIFRVLPRGGFLWSNNDEMEIILNNYGFEDKFKKHNGRDFFEKICD